MASRTLGVLNDLQSQNMVHPKMVAHLEAAKTDFFMGIGNNYRKDLTERIRELRKQRNDTVRELRSMVATASVRRNEALREAGKRLKQAMNRRSFTLNRLNVQVESGLVGSLVADIRSSEALAAYVALLSLDEVVERLNRENEELIKTCMEASRTRQRECPPNKVCVKNLRDALQLVFQYLNSMCAFEPAIGEAVRLLNMMFAEDIVQLKSRATIRKKAKAKRSLAKVSVAVAE